VLERLIGWVHGHKRKVRARAIAKGDPVKAAIVETCLLADERGLDAMTPAQRRVVLVWSARGTIGNGGFRHYYEADWRMPEVAAAFRELGFAEAAGACQRSMSAFPGAFPPPDGDRRWDAVKAADWKALREDERAVFAVSWDELKRALDGYMHRFPADFSLARR